MDGGRLVKIQLPARLVEAMDRAIEASAGYSDRSAFVADAIENLIVDLAEEGAPSSPGPAPDLDAPAVLRTLRADARSALELTESWEGMRARMLDLAQADSLPGWARPSRARSASMPDPDAPLTEHEVLLDDVRRRLNETVHRMGAWSDLAMPAEGGPDALEPLTAELVLTVPTEGEVPLAPESCGAPDKVTWGMHNRDWPTLWALADLAGRTAASSDPIPFRVWREVLGERAGSLAFDLARAGSPFDYAGLPNVRKKGSKSVERFLSLFVGDRPGAGPLFSLGLASTERPWSEVAVAEDRKARHVSEREPVRVTQAGLDLLRALDGFCPAPAPVADSHRVAWLTHLDRWAPLDAELLRAIVAAIEAGNDQRKDLVADVARRLGWAEAGVVAETNVAGMIGRAREWNIVARRQERGRYLLVEGALEALAAHR